MKEDGPKEPERAETTPTPVETVRLAYRNTVEAESARFSTRSVVSGLPEGQGRPESVTVVGEGSGNFAGTRSQAVLQIPMLGEMEVRYVGSVMYQRMPEAFAAGMMPPGKRWVEIDPDELLREEYGTSLSELQEGTQGTPSDQLAYLRGVSDSVEEVGTEEVRGTPTTRYRAQIDLGKAAPEDPEARRAYEEMTRTYREEKIPTEVWIDGEGRLRRLQTTALLALPEGTPSNVGADPTVTTTAEYYDFGAPVNVEPPPEEQIIPFEELKELQERQAPQRQQYYSS